MNRFFYLLFGNSITIAIASYTRAAVLDASRSANGQEVHYEMIFHDHASTISLKEVVEGSDALMI